MNKFKINYLRILHLSLISTINICNLATNTNSILTLDTMI
ncbi:hypothetical protein A1OE_744 [Candidatus Endolissoclinum faulkneri L2]|uniref:Uncharacterized protein n=1 Tax=Candidatus Endolissoclinum faulkneri L2 TaxID=1193729 RepID=K7YHB9_9PROT|nr:hypothetical protein A1OE_744 [Candidatus Endolissoclinum faulkneri L2]